jgi:aerobic carbon-monoxide dehydrogenase medium subunit
MFPAPFEYHRASSVKDALAMLKRFGDDAKLLSGGHSLLPMMKLRLAQPGHLIDVAGVAELSGIEERGGKIVIGAATTHNQIETSDLVRTKLGVLAEAASMIGDVQVRNRGTIGGSLAHADPAADYPAAVLALEGEIRAESESGGRAIKAEDFFVDLMTTALKLGEILTQISFAPIPAGAGCAYLKHPQPASGFAIVGVAALIRRDAKGNCAHARVGITGLAAKAFRAKAVEAALVGKPLDATTIAQEAAHAADGVDALSDIHASSDFRSELARVYTRRALERAASLAKP